MSDKCLVWKENTNGDGRLRPLYWSGVATHFWTDDRRKALPLDYVTAKRIWAAGDTLDRKIHVVELEDDQ